ncbi:MAG: ABC transporter permease [Desulfobulbaceae bacterium]|uniref:Cell division protein FtsX n=1 Tax=Candidatus Desulfatifera sulfidica TaxID=2841691 RepID=A0A8J6NA88_9BACT|nr:ABC transporter permease [Candidatus Desulfatifera sulfidica]
MNFCFAIFRQLGRNLKQTWTAQLMTLITVSLSVLIFSFFYLIYCNMLTAGGRLDNDLRLLVYLEEEPGPEMREQLIRKINDFEKVEQVIFISPEEALARFETQLGDNSDLLADMPHDFLPPSMEITPLKNLRSLHQISLLADYLDSLPGATKVQYGREWVERFYTFTRLLSIIVILSGVLLVLTATLMVSYTIRLTILGREDEIEVLKLVGATNGYIRTPFLLEGVLQGFMGSALGLGALYLLFQWTLTHFAGPSILAIFSLTFIPMPVLGIIIGTAMTLLGIASHVSMRRSLRI